MPLRRSKDNEALVFSNSLTPEDAEKLVKADVHNILKKVKAGKTLTPSELQRIRSVAGETDASVTKAKNLTQLASLLGVTRQTLYAWKKMEGAPVPAANGEHDVIAWREFAKARDLKNSDDAPASSEALKARKLLAEVEQRELKTAIMKGDYIPLAQVREE
ncbi:MAG: hypothetical protein Q7P63_17255 [Verrucomicrobiota bacterium JB022]|nr:hypothetical protein [Verrucomicrobiota bacterium JB022]